MRTNIRKRLFENPEEVIKLANEKSVETVDLKFTDLFGRWHHLTVPVKELTLKLFAEGVGFDGSSTPGFKSVEQSDMVLIPDPSTVLLDPFWESSTLSLICHVAEADTKELFHRDPRLVALRAEGHLGKQEFANESRWSPEFEFYIFDSVAYGTDVNLSTYIVDSQEATWNTHKIEPRNLGHKIPTGGGYHAIPPLDNFYRLRTRMVNTITESGIEVRYHHHEAGGPGQSEIEIKFSGLLETGDVTMWIKYVIKNTARQRGHTVTFMPKPLYGEAGSGMHFHQLLLKDGKPVFYDKGGYAGLSQLALYYIGGLLLHGPALLAFTNPSTNSFKRLVPGYEAPVYLFFSLGNRSATVRIPAMALSPEEKRVEFRPSDATCNIYLALAAQLMAGLDGIKNKVDPTEEGFGPFDKKIQELTPKERRKLRLLPMSLKEVLDALARDHQFLLEGGVFTEDLIETWIDHKMDNEYLQVRNRPHPYEMYLYYDV